MFLLTWSRAYTYNKINMSKPLLKLLKVNIKKQQVCFRWVNITPSINNTKDKIFMSAYCIYSTNSPIYLALVSNPFTNRATPFIYLNFPFFLLFDEGFVLFFFYFLLVVLLSIFCLFCLGLIWFFVSFGYLFFVVLQFSFAKWTRNNFNSFSHVNS